MQTVDERPAHPEARDAVIQTKAQTVEPLPVEYVPFEESFWMRYRPLIWTLLILFFLGIGAVALILPAFVVGC